MTKEQKAISLSAKGPVTVSTLTRDLRTLGVRPGMVLLVHSSLSAMGWVCGGPVAFILALQNVLRSYGTLVMPAHSGDLSDPSLWENPPVPKSWWETIRRTMPAYDPELTPAAVWAWWSNVFAISTRWYAVPTLRFPSPPGVKTP